MRTFIHNLTITTQTPPLRERKYFINLTTDPSQNGDFNLQDGLFTYDDLHLVINEQTDDVKKLLKSSWSATSNIPKLTLLLNQRLLDANKNWKLLEKNFPLISLAPIGADSAAESRFSSQLELELEKFFNKVSVDQLMQNSKSTGTLKITKPCLYIFPASQGDSAYFAVNGYSMLINGGYDRLRPCFWKFINMLQQIDSILITHTDSDSLGGLSSFFKKKVAEPDTKPAVLSVLGNLIPASNGRQPSIVNVAANLISHEVGSSKQAHQSDVDQIIDAIDKLQVKLLPLVKTNENLLTSLNRSNHALNKYEHINLYYKLGHGSLDLYVLSPYVNSIEYKEHYQQQHHGTVLKHMANQKSHLAVQQIYRHLPLSHLATSVVLLVWLPAAPTRQSAANADNNALRLLFTGNAPQHVVFNALDKIKDFELLNEPVYRVKPAESPATTSANAGGRKTSQVVKDTSSSLNSSQLANGSSSRPASKTIQSTGANASSSSASAKPTGEKSTSAGQMNGGHHAESNKSQPNAAASQTKSNTVAAKPPKPAVGSASSKDKDSSATGAAAKDSSAKADASGSAKPEAVKKHPPIPSHNVASASKAKKPDAAESSSASASAEKPDTKVDSKEKKPSSRPSVSSSASNVKKELINGAGEKASTNGTSVKQSQSETSASADSKPSLSASGTSRSSLAKQESTASKPASKPQSAPSTSKPPASSKSSTGTTASSTGDKKESSAKKPSSAAGRSSTAGQTEPKNVVKKEKSAKTLSLSVDKSTPAAAVATAAAAATAVAASAVTTENVPTPEAVAPEQSIADHEPSKNDSVEVPKQEQEESTSEMTERVVHEEQIEQIEKIEQVVNVEQQIEQIEQSLKEPIVELENVHFNTAEPTNKDEFVAFETQPTEQQHQAQVQSPIDEQPPVVESEVFFEQKYEHAHGKEQYQHNLIDVAEPEPATPTTNTPSGQFASESPNLSPVKKDFNNINGESNLVDDDGVVVVAPVVEEQLTNGSISHNEMKNDADLIIENNTNGSEFEIVSGNLNAVQPAAEPAVDDFYRANDDVMTRSFIEDESNPQSNPFNNVDSNAPLVTPVDPAPAVNGHKNLDESCDLNRTHELFEGEDSSINIQEDSVSKSVPSEIEDKLINGIESLKLENSHHQHNDQDPSIQLEPVETARGDEPEQWNLLELPSPVNPIDPISPLETQSKLAANELNNDLNTSNQQAPLIEELPVSSDFAPTNASNVPGSAEKKSLINGKKVGAQQSSTRASVDTSQQAANKTKANSTSSQNQAQKQTNKPTHPLHVHPVYVELTYIPAHGNDHYCDAEFFKRVRARHYVLSSVEPTENILNALCDGKEQWEDKNLQVSLVPTYESETLRKWFLVNEERLSKLKIDILPAANNATITIEDNADLTCQVYKLEF